MNLSRSKLERDISLKDEYQPKSVKNKFCSDETEILIHKSLKRLYNENKLKSIQFFGF